MVDSYLVAYGVISFAFHVAQRKARRKNMHSTGSLLLSALFFMSVCDLGWSVVYLIEFIPPAMGFPRGLHGDNKDLCATLGLLSQFFSGATRGWYFTIALMALLLVMGYSTSKIESVFGTRFQHIFVWTLSVVSSVLPLFGRGYGPTGHDGNECWIVGEDSPYRAVFFGPVFSFVAFDFMLFGYTVYVTYSLEIPDAWSLVIKQMFAFVGVFLFVWIVPAAHRLYELITETTSPFWLWFPAMILRGSAGFANFAIWYRSRIMESLISGIENPVGLTSVAKDKEEDEEEEEEETIFASETTATDYESLSEYVDMGKSKKSKKGKKLTRFASETELSHSSA